MSEMKPGLGVCALMTGLLSAASPAIAGTLTVEIAGFRNNDGSARVCLYDREKGFPLKSEHAVRVARVGIAGDMARAVFMDMPPGVYAVSVLHDENGNDRMDTNALGMPKEGVGASNNPKSIFGPPGFEDARFTLTGADMAMRVTIHYP